MAVGRFDRVGEAVFGVGEQRRGLLGLIAILLAIFWLASAGMTIGVGFLWIIMKERAAPVPLILVSAEASESGQRAETEPSV